LRIAAHISWISLAAEFVLFVICALIHNNPLSMASGFIFPFVVILSLVLAIIALLGVREYGPRGILIPALTGICCSGLLFLLGIGMVIYIHANRKTFEQERLNAMHDPANQTTNAVSSSE